MGLVLSPKIKTTSNVRDRLKKIDEKRAFVLNVNNFLNIKKVSIPHLFSDFVILIKTYEYCFFLFSVFTLPVE